jgi:hypothetical protein
MDRNMIGTNNAFQTDMIFERHAKKMMCGMKVTTKNQKETNLNVCFFDCCHARNVASGALEAVETASPALVSLAHHLETSLLTKTSSYGWWGENSSSTGDWPVGWN